MCCLEVNLQHLKLQMNVIIVIQGILLDLNNRRDYISSLPLRSLTEKT